MVVPQRRTSASVLTVHLPIARLALGLRRFDRRRVAWPYPSALTNPSGGPGSGTRPFRARQASSTLSTRIKVDN